MREIGHMWGTDFYECVRYSCIEADCRATIAYFQFDLIQVKVLFTCEYLKNYYPRPISLKLRRHYESECLSYL